MKERFCNWTSMKGLAIIILCPLLASAYPADVNSTEQGQMTGKSYCNRVGSSGGSGGDPMAEHRPDDSRSNLALIYYLGAYFSSGALITSIHLLISYHHYGAIIKQAIAMADLRVRVVCFEHQPYGSKSNLYNLTGEVKFIEDFPYLVVLEVILLNKKCEYIPTRIPMRQPNDFSTLVRRRWKDGTGVQDSLLQNIQNNPLVLKENILDPSQIQEDEILGMLLFREIKLVGMSYDYEVENDVPVQIKYANLGALYGVINTALDNGLRRSL